MSWTVNLKKTPVLSLHHLVAEDAKHHTSTYAISQIPCQAMRDKTKFINVFLRSIHSLAWMLLEKNCLLRVIMYRWFVQERLNEDNRYYVYFQLFFSNYHGPTRTDRFEPYVPAKSS